MATNQFLPFGMGESPNRISYDDWSALPARLTGFQSGIASSQQFNYILAQGGVAGYILGQLIVEQLAQDATLSSPDTLFANFKSAVAKFVPSGIADKSIVTAKIADLAITTAKISALGVTSDKLAANSVLTDKIADLSVTVGKIADGSVTNAKIASGTVAFDRIASSAIATESQAQAGTADNVLMTPLKVAKAISAQIPPAVPPGMLGMFAGMFVPDGWLLCNGAAVSRATYAWLFATIGTVYGAGDGSSTFNLPNLNGRFLEGTTNTGFVGTYVEAGLPNITGRHNGTPWVDTTSGAFSNPFVQANVPNGSSNANNFIDFSAAGSDSIYGKSSTVQPSSVRSLIIIKA